MIYLVVFGRLIKLNPFRKEPIGGVLKGYYFLSEEFGFAIHYDKNSREYKQFREEEEASNSEWDDA